MPGSDEPRTGQPEPVAALSEEDRLRARVADLEHENRQLRDALLAMFNDEPEEERGRSGPVLGVIKGGLAAIVGRLISGWELAERMIRHAQERPLRVAGIGATCAGACAATIIAAGGIHIPPSLPGGIAHAPHALPFGPGQPNPAQRPGSTRPAWASHSPVPVPGRSSAPSPSPTPPRSSRPSPQPSATPTPTPTPTRKCLIYMFGICVKFSL